MDIYNFEEVTGVTGQQSLVLLDPPGGATLLTFLLEVTSGTVKFAVSGIRSTTYSNASGAKRMVTCANGSLEFQLGSSGDKFVVTAVV
jgi:hypothetical protein